MYTFLLWTSLAAAAPPPGAQTYYVRADGGSAEQCDGRHDAAYAGKGRHKACAWRHPFEALPPGGPARIAAGDTLVIASGAYMMGRGAAGTDNLEKCRADWPWDCHVASLPSGAARDRPTRILGAGWDHGCANPPQLWGTERAAHVLDLQGSSNVEIACLEITDHSSCIEFHAGARQIEPCERDKEPYGPWAGVGIAAADSSHVTISDVLVHGMAHDGFRVGRVRDWTLERTRILANGWSGWNGDIGEDSSNSGSMVFRDVEIAWNGCAESFPDATHVGCWGQEEGGYGDGLGVGLTGGNWLFEHVHVHHNTQDGIDLWHARGDTTVVFRDVHAEANAGNQLKATGSATVEQSVLDGSCSALAGLGSLQTADMCRAGGNTLALNLAAQATLSVSGNEIHGEGDCLIQLTCADKDCRSAHGDIVGNHLQGELRKDARGRLPRPPCSVWVEPQLRGAQLDFTQNRQELTRTPGCPAGITTCRDNAWSPLSSTKH